MANFRLSPKRKAAIEALIESRMRSWPATSGMNASFGRGIYSAALRHFLQAYIRAHGRMPEGVHQFRWGGSTPGTGSNVAKPDFTEMRRAADPVEAAG